MKKIQTIEDKILHLYDYDRVEYEQIPKYGIPKDRYLILHLTDNEFNKLPKPFIAQIYSGYPCKIDNMAQLELFNDTFDKETKEFLQKAFLVGYLFVELVK